MQYLNDYRWVVLVLPGFIALFVVGLSSPAALPSIGIAQLPLVYIALTTFSLAIPFGCAHIVGRVRNKSYPVDSLARQPWFIAFTLISAIVVGEAFGLLNSSGRVSAALSSALGNSFVIDPSRSGLLRDLLLLSYSREFAKFDGQPYISADRKRFANRYVKLYLSSGEVYEGVVASKPDQSEKIEVYLSPACLISGPNVTLVEGPGVWLSLSQLKSIHFLYDVCSECATAIEIAAGKQPSQMCPFKASH